MEEPSGPSSRAFRSTRLATGPATSIVPLFGGRAAPPDAVLCSALAGAGCDRSCRDIETRVRVIGAGEAVARCGDAGAGRVRVGVRRVGGRARGAGGRQQHLRPHRAATEPGERRGGRLGGAPPSRLRGDDDPRRRADGAEPGPANIHEAQRGGRRGAGLLRRGTAWRWTGSTTSCRWTRAWSATSMCATRRRRWRTWWRRRSVRRCGW